MQPILFRTCLAFLLGSAATSLLASEDGLRAALSFHASFDQSFDADFSRGSKVCQVKSSQALIPFTGNEEARLAANEGRFGGALHFPKKGATRPQYDGSGMLNYNESNWNASVSVWLRLTPDKDLEPGYCDPVQIVGDDSKKGFIFLEWSKDETPRFFRYAIRPLHSIWNPNNVNWADIPFDQRPMVQVARAPFSRATWTHVVFTLDKINASGASGSLYLNSQKQGSIDGWDLRFGWDPVRTALVLGASYVGHIDDLAVFDKPLSATEVETLFQLPQGVSDLH